MCAAPLLAQGLFTQERSGMPAKRPTAPRQWSYLNAGKSCSAQAIESSAGDLTFRSPAVEKHDRVRKVESALECRTIPPVHESWCEARGR